MTNVTLKAVHSVRQYDKPGWLVFQITVDNGGEDFPCGYLSSPDDPAPVNREIREWLTANPSFEILPYEAPPEVFEPLKPVDFELGMLTLNITSDQIDEAINQMPEPDRTIAKIYWTRASQFERDDPLIEQIAAVFGKTPEDINAAWRYAQG